MRRNIRRQMELGLVALSLSCLALLYIVIVVALIQTAKGESVITAPPTPQQTLVQKCAHLNESHDLGEWDAASNSYVPNLAWWDCMGVGIK